MRSAPLAAAHAAAFVMAGNATLTLRSTKTDARYTYKVRLADKKQPSDAPAYFVSLLSGPDNDADFTYLGMIFSTGFKLTKKSRLPTTALPVRAFAYFYSNCVVAGRMPSELQVWHEGRCGACGRKLTVPESLVTGLGPECAAKAGVDWGAGLGASKIVNANYAEVEGRILANPNVRDAVLTTGRQPYALDDGGAPRPLPKGHRKLDGAPLTGLVEPGMDDSIDDLWREDGHRFDREASIEGLDR